MYEFLLEKKRWGGEGVECEGERKKMVARMREALVKLVVISGIPSVMVAVGSLAQVLKEGDRDESTTRVGWQVSGENEKKGKETIEKLYGSDAKGVSESFKSFQDFEWISSNITYGLFLADHRILDIKETALVTLPAVLATGLQGPSFRNLKAALRLGFSAEEVESVQRIVDVMLGWKDGAEKKEFEVAGGVKGKDVLKKLKEEEGSRL